MTVIGQGARTVVGHTSREYAVHGACSKRLVAASPAEGAIGVEGAISEDRVIADAATCRRAVADEGAVAQVEGAALAHCAAAVRGPAWRTGAHSAGAGVADQGAARKSCSAAASKCPTAIIDARAFGIAARTDATAHSRNAVPATDEVAGNKAVCELSHITIV